MAISASIWIRFSDGTCASLVNNSVTAETLTECTTGGNGYAQTSGVSVGQAFTGLQATHAVCKVSEEDTANACFNYAYFQGPDGAIICPIQGGGNHCEDMPRLVKPVVMQTGVTAQVKLDVSADAAIQLASTTVYCTNGKCDAFFVKAVDATKTELVNAQGSTIGQALAGSTIAGSYSSYSSTYGLNESQDGNGAFYLESSEGALKGFFPPDKGNGLVIQWTRYPVMIQQNDGLFVMSDNS